MHFQGISVGGHPLLKKGLKDLAHKQILRRSCCRRMRNLVFASTARVAQLVERPAVNRQVPGSSPGPGAHGFKSYFFILYGE